MSQTIGTITPCAATLNEKANPQNAANSSAFSLFMGNSAPVRQGFSLSERTDRDILAAIRNKKRIFM
jgi:hypothetical protein